MRNMKTNSVGGMPDSATAFCPLASWLRLVLPADQKNLYPNRRWILKGRPVLSNVQSCVRPIILVVALVVCEAWVLEAQIPEQSGPLPVSIERVREELAKAPAQRLKLNGIQTPVAVFKTTVEADYMPSFKEQLEKEFKLNEFQRQSQEWSSKCCGLDLIGLAKSVDRFLKKREARKIRDQVVRELAQIEAATKK